MLPRADLHLSELPHIKVTTVQWTVHSLPASSYINIYLSNFPHSQSARWTMKTFVVLFAFASVCTGSELNGFQLTYGSPDSGLGYNDMPWTVEEATAQRKWGKIGVDKRLNVHVYSQHDDPRLLLLFDKRGNIAGIRMSFLKEDVERKAKEGGYSFDFDYDNIPMYERDNYLGKDLWHTTVLFVSPRKLASGGRRRLNKQTDNVAEGVYARPEGKWIELSRDECRTSKDFVEANCYPGMGKHYFFKLNEEGCKTRKPLFALYNDGRLSGFGLAGFGSFSTNPKTQSYFENFQVTSSRAIVPNGPPCIPEYIEKYGLTLMHVFLTKDAPKIFCPSLGWRAINC